MRNDNLLMPVETEFLDSLNVLFDSGMFGKVKQRLIPLALEFIRISLVGHVHPFETLRGLTDLQWENLLEHPYTPSLISQLLDELEIHPKLQNLLGTLREPEVMQRLRVEWLYEMTVGRFEHTVPYLAKEEELLEDWANFCQTCRDSSPFKIAEEEARRAAATHGAGHSESARRLFKLSFMAACRKLFVLFSGARETWIGCCTMENFKMEPPLRGLLRAKDSVESNDQLSLRFGLVDHVYYLKPTLEQINRYAECVKEPDFVFSIQRKLCPFVTLAGEGSNLMADVYYRMYLPRRLRELHSAPSAPKDDGFIERTGISQALFAQIGFTPINQETLCFLTAKSDSLPRLGPFLCNPRTEAGLLRQRLYRAILDPILMKVTQETLFSLCRQWNPLMRTPEGATLSLMAYVESKASRVARYDPTDPGAESTRRRAILDELLQILTQNTQTWQKNMEQDSFVVDRSRTYFITVLDKAIHEHSASSVE